MKRQITILLTVLFTVSIAPLHSFAAVHKKSVSRSVKSKSRSKTSAKKRKRRVVKRKPPQHTGLQARVDAVFASYEYLYRPIRPFITSGFSVNTSLETVDIYTNSEMSYIPYRPQLVHELYSRVDSVIHEKYPGFRITIYANNQEISTLIPNMYRPANEVDRQYLPPEDYTGPPLVASLSKPFTITKGLQHRHLAMWDSHGRYFNVRGGRWEWQREYFFQTVEDKFTMSYILSGILPMLENAGATVLLPRERDFQTNEVVVDNDTILDHSLYKELGAGWENGRTPGFAYRNKLLKGMINPFTEGTFRQIATQPGNVSSAEWIPDIPAAGWYSVSVAYKTVGGSVSDAHYTVFHTGGKSDFSVNQQMGGGTWIYLGTFYFDKGTHPETGKVMLTSQAKGGKTVTADAVRFGGGMGNIARPDPVLTSSFISVPVTASTPAAVSDTLYDSGNYDDYDDDVLSDSTSESIDTLDSEVHYSERMVYDTLNTPQTSGYPRYLECARYWLQWAGMPPEIYSKRKDGRQNDYNDDIWARPMWVNYLNSNSLYNKIDTTKGGLSIPVELSLALHSDAGSKKNDSIVGMLAICTTMRDGSYYFNNGQSRRTSRDLADLVQEQIVRDVRAAFEPGWHCRGIWDRSYAESRETDVPSMLLEMMSHENFADMRYGLDPRFRFTLSRAVYKAILKYIAFQHNKPYVVQPLPVTHLATQFTDNTHIQLSWQATPDTLEATATPTGYVVYTGKDGQGFDNGLFVKNSAVTLPVEQGKIYSYKVTAVNDGGESMPSEILSVCRTNNSAPVAMIINAFDRISAPTWVKTPTFGGFIDNGVPDRLSLSYAGQQTDFSPMSRYRSGSDPGFGNSAGDMETKIIAGNSFNYPYVHGQALQAAGYSFVSASRAAVEDEMMNLSHYQMVDLIFGKERKTKIGTNPEVLFNTLTGKLKQALTGYCEYNGNLFVSGSFLASDVWNGSDIDASDTVFASRTLKYRWNNFDPNSAALAQYAYATVSDYLLPLMTPVDMMKWTYPLLSGNVQGNGLFNGEWTFCTQLNEKQYQVEMPDGLLPADDPQAQVIAQYADNGVGAAIAYKGNYKVIAAGFPFEALATSAQRDEWMKRVVQFFREK